MRSEVGLRNKNLCPTAHGSGGNLLMRVQRLRAGYLQTDVVQNVNIDIEYGEFVGLAGHNGSGKSTVLLSIAGLIRHQCEVLELKGKNVKKMTADARARRGLGLLLQRNAVFPELTVADNLTVAYGVKNWVESVEWPAPLNQLLKGILNRRSMLAGALSGGERRLLGLAMVLSRKPTIVLADEPTLGLFEKVEIEIFKGLKGLVDKNSRSVIIVSHNLSLLEKFCKRTYVVIQGRIAAEYRREKSVASLREVVVNNGMAL